MILASKKQFWIQGSDEKGEFNIQAFQSILSNTKSFSYYETNIVWVEDSVAKSWDKSIK